jgi:hypothetical protein
MAGGAAQRLGGFAQPGEVLRVGAIGVVEFELESDTGDASLALGQFALLATLNEPASGQTHPQQEKQPEQLRAVHHGGLIHTGG